MYLPLDPPDNNSFFLTNVAKQLSIVRKLQPISFAHFCLSSFSIAITLPSFDLGLT